MRVRLVARNLRTIGERLQDQICLIRMGDFKKRRPEPREPVLCSSPGEGGLCSYETKHNRKTSPRPSRLFQRVDYRNKGQNPEKLS